MKDRNNDPKLAELSPLYDNYVDQALDYANGHLLPEDATAFRERMKSDEMFRRVVAPVLDAHDAPAASPDEIRAGWTDLRSRIAAAGGTPPSAEAIEQALGEKTSFEQRVKARSRANWRMIAKIAAVFAFLMLIPVGVISYLEVVHIQRITVPSNVTIVVELPDASVVRLEPDAFLRYPKNLGERETRWVEFSGEGEFTVAARPGRSFRVETKRADVTVLATRFTLRVSGDATVVDVVEGRVSVQRKDGIGELTGRPMVVDAGIRVRVTQAGILTEMNTRTRGVP